MDGTVESQDGRRCPECGVIAKSERAMHGTRRRPGRVVVGVVVLVLAGTVAAWSRWEVAGPKMLPGAVLLQLSTLDRADIRDEILRRIDESTLNTSQLEALTRRMICDEGHPDPTRADFATKTIGYLLSFVIREPVEGRPDPELRRLAVAGLLGPHYAARVLRDPDPAVRSGALASCVIVASRSIEARHAIMAAAADPERSVSSGTANLLSLYMWLIEGLVPDRVAMKASYGRMMWLRERIGPWIRSRPATRETMATLAHYLIDPTLPGAEFLDGAGDAGVGASLLLSTDGTDDQTFAVVAGLADPGPHGTEAIVPLRLLAGFQWRDEIGPLLLKAIENEDDEVRVAGWDVLAHFGADARGLAEDVLAVIGRPEIDAERRAPQIAMEMGVPSESLRDAGLSVLRTQREAWRLTESEPIVIENRDVTLGGGVIDWISTVAEPGDDEVVAVLRELVFETEPGLGCRAALAYLRVSGDGEGVTRFVLDAYGRTTTSGYDRVHRQTGSRVLSATRSLLLRPGLDVDEVMAWIGDDPIRAEAIARLLAGATRGRVPNDAIENVERLATALLVFDHARTPAERMLEIIRVQRERDAED